MTSTQRHGVLLRIASECIERGVPFPVAAIVAPQIGLKRAAVGHFIRRLARAGEFRIEPVAMGRPWQRGGAQLVRRIRLLPMERVT